MILLSWVQAPHWALCWQFRAWRLLRIVSLPLCSSPAQALSLSLSLKINKDWRKILKIYLWCCLAHVLFPLPITMANWKSLETVGTDVMQFCSFPGEASHQAHCGVLPESAVEGHLLVCGGMNVLYIPKVCKKTVVYRCIFSYICWNQWAPHLHMGLEGTGREDSLTRGPCLGPQGVLRWDQPTGDHLILQVNIYQIEAPSSIWTKTNVSWFFFCFFASLLLWEKTS